MLGIILGILKIIAFIVLFILAFLILIILLILIAPLNYKTKLLYKEKIDIKLNANYFFYIFRFHLVYKDNLEYSLMIFNYIKKVFVIIKDLQIEKMIFRLHKRSQILSKLINKKNF